jgi:hypothetical protein
MADESRLGDGSAKMETPSPAAGRRAALMNPPALRDGTDLVGGRPQGGGFMIGPMTFMVLVFVQAALLVATAVSLTLIVARPDLLQQLTGAAASTARRPASGPARAPRVSSGAGRPGSSSICPGPSKSSPARPPTSASGCCRRASIAARWC